MKRTLFALLILAALFVGSVLLQFYLSRRESRWPGLVLPIIAFLLGLLYPLNMVMPPEGMGAGFLIQMLVVWLLGSIPALVFLAIYLSCRGKKRQGKQLEKMNIQDLD